MRAEPECDNQEFHHFETGSGSFNALSRLPLGSSSWVRSRATQSFVARTQSFLLHIQENWWAGKLFSKTYWLSHHYYLATVAYLLTLICVSAAMIHQSERGGAGMAAADALFLSASAATMTGLSSTDFTATRPRTQLIVWVHIILCSPILISVVPLTLRRRSFRAQARFEQRRSRQELNGNDLNEVEYAALGQLRCLVLCYYVGVQVAGWLLLWLFLGCRGGPQSGFADACWPALFASTSIFHNNGLLTLKAGVPWDKDNAFVRVGVLSTLSVLTLAGNSCFPILLRALLKLCRRRMNGPATELLLSDPRRCYTHLFPGYATKWLATITVGLIAAQIVALVISENGLLAKFPPEMRAEATVFHSISSRTAGVAVLPLGRMSPASCFVFSLCMWISISPVVVVTRSTSKPSRNLSNYDLSGCHLEDKADLTRMRSQLSTFLSDNLIVLAVLFFIILVAERDTFAGDKFHWIIFEFCSSWGTVGLSMGTKSYSFSGDWSRTAQASLMAVMVLGRLRGLPLSIDPSVRLSRRFPDHFPGAASQPMSTARSRVVSRDAPRAGGSFAGFQHDLSVIGERFSATPSSAARSQDNFSEATDANGVYEAPPAMFDPRDARADAT